MTAEKISSRRFWCRRWQLAAVDEGSQSVNPWDDRIYTLVTWQRGGNLRTTRHAGHVAHLFADPAGWRE